MAREAKEGLILALEVTVAIANQQIRQMAIR